MKKKMQFNFLDNVLLKKSNRETNLTWDVNDERGQMFKKKKLPEEENSSSTLVGDHKVKVSTH